jgi:GTP-dependent phosphoenolpyruvate carboxykinase
MALRKNKMVEQIVETVVGGVKSPQRLDVGALWFGKRFMETNRQEFSTCSRRAGITVMDRMSPEATAAIMGELESGFASPGATFGKRPNYRLGIYPRHH